MIDSLLYVYRSFFSPYKKSKIYVYRCRFAGIPSFSSVDLMSSALQPSTPTMFEQSSAMTSCKGYRLTVWILFAGVLNSPFRTTVSKDFMKQAIHLSITTNVTPQKRNGRNGVLKFFSQGLEEMHQDLSKDG